MKRKIIKDFFVKFRQFIMDNPYIKRFGIIAGIVMLLLFFIAKSIVDTEINNIYLSIKNCIMNRGTKVISEDYEKLIDQGLVYKNDLKFGDAIECYSAAAELLNVENNKMEVAKCYAEMGALYLHKSDIISGVYWLDESEKLVEEIEIDKDNYHDLCDIYLKIAVGKINYNEFQEALLIYKEIIRIYDEMNNIWSDDLALIYDGLAGLYYKLGDIPNAMKCAEKAREMIEDTLGSTHESTAKIYGTICFVYCDIDYEYAKKYGERAYQIMLNYDMQKKLDMITICQAMSYLYQNTDLSKSYQYACKRYEYSKLFLGEMHIDTIMSELVLANYESNEKRVAILEELNKKVIANYNENTMETAIVWNNLANAYMNIYNEEEAKKLYFQCLYIFENLLGSNHPYVASVYSDLALWAKNAGDYLLQIKYAETAQKIYRERYGEMNFEVAKSYLIKGDAEFMYSGDYNKSLRYYEDARKIYLGLYGETNIFVAQCDKRSANVYITQHDLDTAEELIRSCVNIYENEFGSISEDMAEVLVVQSQINLYNKKFDLAIKDANRTIDICKLYGRENSPFAITAYYILCNCYLEKADWKNVSYCAQRVINLNEMNEPYLSTVPEYIGAHSLLAIYYSTNTGYEDLAKDTIAKALELCQQCNNYNIKVQTYYDAARVYNYLGLKDSALDYVNNAYSLAKEIDESNPQLDAIISLINEIDE